MEKHKIPTLHIDNAGITTEYGQVFSFPLHIHSYCEMLLYEPFDGQVTVNEQSIVPNERIAILILPGDFHEIAVHSRTNARFMKISFPSNLYEKATMPKSSMLLHSVPLDSLFYKTYTEAVNIAVDAHFKKALTSVLVCMLAQNGQAIESKRALDSNRYSIKAVEIINESYDENLTLASVAKALSITPQHLSNTFKTNIGISFSDYLTAIRLQHAEKLLLETSESITSISELCGYRNFSHFIRSFKNTHGVPPSKYRKSRL